MKYSPIRNKVNASQVAKGLRENAPSLVAGEETAYREKLVRISEIAMREHKHIILVTGPSASGKTTSAKRIASILEEHGKKVLVLDRPNPNGHYVDGPILDMKYKSGVGWLPIPIVHGLTLGELARMVNGEKWLPQGRTCELTVIPCKNYTHQTLYRLPIPPSPNLPNMKAVYLYPSLCFFEATPVSLGRGTSLPFQIYGHPNMLGYNFSFTPRSIAGAKNPPQLNRKCYGVDLSQLTDEEILAKGIDLSYLIDAYRNLHLDDFFFSSFFEKLTGVGYVRKMIEAGKSADAIKARWQPDVHRFKQQRKPYLLYPE